MQLVERLVILRITILATLYRPPPITSPTVTGLEKLLSSKEEASLAKDCIELLSQEPNAFVARLWYSTLGIYQRFSVLPPRAPPPRHLASGGLDRIQSSVETQSTALNLPAAVVAAVVMGALRIDEEQRNAATSGRLDAKPRSLLSRKEAQMRGTDPSLVASAPADGTQAGIASAKAICEWILAAHSAEGDWPAGTASLSDMQRNHLRDQHHRVLTLYTLHILGSRLHQWEYAGEVVRLATSVAHDGAEEHVVQERAELLRQLDSAKVHIETRGERRRAASEQARAKWDEEKKRRVTSSVGGGGDPGQAQEGTHAQVQAHAHAHAHASMERAKVEDARKRADRSREKRPSSKRVSSASGSSSAGSEDERAKKPPSASTVTDATLGDSFADKRQHIAGHASRLSSARGQEEHRATVPAPSAKGTSRHQDDEAEMRLGIFRRLLRANPLALVRYLSAIVAALFILRRAFMPARQPSGPSTITSSSSDASQRTRDRLRRSRREEQGFVSRVIAKMWETLRMGTSVTYL
ncbi:hypothetical protein FA10DRAFT_264553 [Acaromyces ingoldii]|uniref:Uncharacterized protein n=1 Tax=Acaromyces ingoldii TaxID=215250 RepID=A0A316YZ73_9BASI|nr:hypothetical protein FA10DRAFT_264553 [Acaromyces ingoldii]PWN93958.1 hypothetical protein FA10DRAFT_264553 [Acaromyces ingoldii]